MSPGHGAEVEDRAGGHAQLYAAFRVSSGSTAGALELLDLLGARGGEDLAAIAGDDDVVLDPHADAAELVGGVGRGGGDVEPGLDRDHHAGLERARLALAGVR